MRCHFLRVFERGAIGKVSRDARGAKGVFADARGDAGGDRNDRENGRGHRGRSGAGGQEEMGFRRTRLDTPARRDASSNARRLVAAGSAEDERSQLAADQQSFKGFAFEAYGAVRVHGTK